ncbi:hypothetical protein KKF04_03375, partial [Patescibacteria group bacterium]|nr:hypothetical protein [Patescibacteria group bacterium]
KKNSASASPSDSDQPSLDEFRKIGNSLIEDSRLALGGVLGEGRKRLLRRQAFMNRLRGLSS